MKKTLTSVASLVLVLVGVVCGAGIPDLGLVAWYPFTGPSNFADGSGNGNNLYLNVSGNGPSSVSDRFGTANAADSFYNDYLVGNARSLPSGDSDRTISIWANPWSLNSTQCLFYYGDTTAGKYCKIEITNEGINNRLHVSNGLSELSVLCVPYASTKYPSFGEKEWNHIAVTITKNETKIYTNNRLDTTGVITGWNTTKDSIVVGACKWIPSTGYTKDKSNFWGKIDDIAIYRVALSSTQITQLYNATSTIEATKIIPSNAAIQKTMENNDKSLRIYNIQGRTTRVASFGVNISRDVLTIIY